LLLNQLSFNKLIGDRPRIEYGAPKNDADGNWVLSGKVIVEFVQGPFVPTEGENFKTGTGLAIAVPFSDAKNEREALRQAAGYLQQVSAEIREVADALLQISQHNQT
jgi:hypothetical protein